MTEPWETLAGMLALSGDETAALAGIAKAQRKQEWLACRVLLKEMLGKQTAVTYDSERKPHLAGSGMEVSMSHSGEYVCVYVRQGAAVGVDVQQMKPSISRGAFYFLNEAELEWVDLQDNVQMHLIWSAKESVFKYAGDAAVDLKKHITILAFSGNQKGRFEVNLQKDGKAQTIPVQFDTFENYVLTWTL